MRFDSEGVKFNCDLGWLWALVKGKSLSMDITCVLCLWGMEGRTDPPPECVENPKKSQDVVPALRV